MRADDTLSRAQPLSSDVATSTGESNTQCSSRRQVAVWERLTDRERGQWSALSPDTSAMLERALAARQVSAELSDTDDDIGDRGCVIVFDPKGRHHYQVSRHTDADAPRMDVRRTTVQWSFEDLVHTPSGTIVQASAEATAAGTGTEGGTVVGTAATSPSVLPRGGWHTFCAREMTILERTLRLGQSMVELPAREGEFKCCDAACVFKGVRQCDLHRRIMRDRESGCQMRMRRLCQTSNDFRAPIGQPPELKEAAPQCSPARAPSFVLKIPPQSERIEIASLFSSDPNMFGYEIASIQKIENATSVERYQRTKSRMGNAANEHLLFHGCPPDVIRLICREGFDTRLAGKNATTYGRGAYFARYPSYSHKFSDVVRSPRPVETYQMFVARVCIGRYVKGHHTFVRPPRIDTNDDSPFYDSTVDDVRDPHIFVIYDTTQAYPEYIVSYKRSLPLDCKRPASCPPTLTRSQQQNATADALIMSMAQPKASSTMVQKASKGAAGAKGAVISKENLPPASTSGVGGKALATPSRQLAHAMPSPIRPPSAMAAVGTGGGLPAAPAGSPVPSTQATLSTPVHVPVAVSGSGSGLTPAQITHLQAQQALFQHMQQQSLQQMANGATSAALPPPPPMRIHAPAPQHASPLSFTSPHYSSQGTLLSPLFANPYASPFNSPYHALAAVASMNAAAASAASAASASAGGGRGDDSRTRPYSSFAPTKSASDDRTVAVVDARTRPSAVSTHCDARQAKSSRACVDRHAPHVSTSSSASPPPPPPPPLQSSLTGDAFNTSALMSSLPMRAPTAAATSNASADAAGRGVRRSLAAQLHRESHDIQEPSSMVIVPPARARTPGPPSTVSSSAAPATAMPHRRPRHRRGRSTAAKRSRPLTSEFADTDGRRAGDADDMCAVLQPTVKRRQLSLPRRVRSPTPDTDDIFERKEADASMSSCGAPRSPPSPRFSMPRAFTSPSTTVGGIEVPRRPASAFLPSTKRSTEPAFHSTGAFYRPAAAAPVIDGGNDRLFGVAQPKRPKGAAVSQWRHSRHRAPAPAAGGGAPSVAAVAFSELDAAQALFEVAKMSRQ